MSSGYKPIEDYGVIGDMHTVALVGIDGSIDFMCFPHFDSPSVFAALLDASRGGRFQVAPVKEQMRRRQMYLPDTNVLLTQFYSYEGMAELSDFMPVEDGGGYAYNVVRRIKCVRGCIEVRMLCAPRFDYGRAQHTVEQTGDGVVFAATGPERTALRLRSTAPMSVRDGAAVAELTLRTGEWVAFTLEDASAGVDTPCRVQGYSSSAFKATVNYWRGWLADCQYEGRWREMVHRSALVLKLLTSSRHGSLVAAPTFGLPEEIGGERNWDYRYTWIRDASFTLYALLRLGFRAEAAAFNDWVETRCEALEDASALQIMYGLDGRRVLTEQTLDHLEGYWGSRPVRIGNAAYGQLQLDIYGELLDSIYLYDKYGEPVNYDLWRHLARIVDWVCDNYAQPDEGIWEVRGGRRHMLYSRVLCWVAIDRGLRLARRRSLPCDSSRWERCRDAIYKEVFTEFWDPERRTFVQSKGSKVLDAAALIMPLIRMISPVDPRWLSTLAAIEQELVDDSLVYRYRSEDGLAGKEGTFSICTFWYVECLSRAGRLQEARLCFEKMLSHANHLGLYAEELGPCGEHLGNFPQAFTHLALISAAYDLDRRLRTAGQPV